MSGPGVEGLQQFVGLRQQVPAEAGVGLLAVPGAALPQHPHQLVEAGQLGRRRLGQLRDVERGQVVGAEAAVQLGPLHLEHGLVGRAEALEDHGPGPALHRQLDLRQHPAAVAARHQQRPGPAGRGHREPVAVHQPDPLLHRVDPQPGPGQIQKRHGRTHVQRHSASGPGLSRPGAGSGRRADTLGHHARGGSQQLHGALQHQRRARHRVEQVAVGGRRLDQSGGDGLVHLVEAVGGLVHLVESRSRIDHFRRGVAGGAEIAAVVGGDQSQGLGRDQIGTGRPQTHDRDPAPAHPVSPRRRRRP